MSARNNVLTLHDNEGGWWQIAGEKNFILPRIRGSHNSAIDD